MKLIEFSNSCLEIYLSRKVDGKMIKYVSFACMKYVHDNVEHDDKWLANSIINPVWMKMVGKWP